MLQQDTLYITDSVSCKYILIDKNISQKDTILPIESLWSSKSLAISTVNTTDKLPENNKANDNVLSSVTLAFFILLVLFSREIINIFPLIFKSIFKLKNHYKLEDKLALTRQRDVVSIVAALYFPVLITLMNSNYIADKYRLLPLNCLLISLLIIFVYWLIRKTLYGILSWVTKDKVTFKMIEKIGYNHLIISVIFSLPSILFRFIWPQISDITTLNTLLFCCLIVYCLYIIRGYQIIISHRYSHFFYILYLCGIELLPFAILANLILSY